MASITDIHFSEDITLNGTTIKKGTNTQVRHDLGCGSIWINGEGKIAEAQHYYPIRGDEGVAYAKELLTFTGGIESNMGTLFFNKGQLVNLDFTAEEVSRWLIGHLEPKTSNTVNGLDRTLTEEEGKVLFDEMDRIRETILKELPEDSNPSWHSFKLAYESRPSLLVDPFQE